MAVTRTCCEPIWSTSIALTSTLAMATLAFEADTFVAGTSMAADSTSAVVTAGEGPATRETRFAYACSRRFVLNSFSERMVRPELARVKSAEAPKQAHQSKRQIFAHQNQTTPTEKKTRIDGETRTRRQNRMSDERNAKPKKKKKNEPLEVKRRVVVGTTSGMA